MEAEKKEYVIYYYPYIVIEAKKILYTKNWHKSM